MPPGIEREEFDGYIRRHEADENAHSAERHRQNNDWAATILRQAADIATLENRMNAHDVAHAQAKGELDGVMNAVRIGFVALSVLVTAFGGAILVKLGVI